MLLFPVDSADVSDSFTYCTDLLSRLVRVCKAGDARAKVIKDTVNIIKGTINIIKGTTNITKGTINIIKGTTNITKGTVYINNGTVNIT